jgi:hypothetical protein
MKKIKGVISCFLSATIIISSVSVGFTAFAQDENNKQETTTQVASVDEPSAVSVEDLDENYQALAQALKSDYVNDTSHYTIGDRAVVATDNDTNDILSAVNAFYAIVTNWGTYSRGTTHYEIATSVAVIGQTVWITPLNNFCQVVALPQTAIRKTSIILLQ